MATIKVKNPETGLWEAIGLPVEEKGMQMDLLWTNPNPLAAFAAQTVAIDLKTVEILAIPVVGYLSLNGTTVTHRKICLFDLTDCRADTNEFVLSTTYYSKIAERRFSVTENGIIFGDGAFYNTYSDYNSVDTTYLNHALIPTAIYAVRNTSSSNSTGDGTTESITHPGCFYRMVNGVQEWLNPPMESGVEYRTTERYNGKPVYTWKVDLGSLPNASTKIVYIADANRDLVVGVCGDGAGYAIPYVWDQTNYIYLRAYIASAAIAVEVKTGKDYSAYTASATVKYTKTTD